MQMLTDMGEGGKVIVIDSKLDGDGGAARALRRQAVEATAGGAV